MRTGTSLTAKLSIPVLLVEIGILYKFYKIKPLLSGSMEICKNAAILSGICVLILTGAGESAKSMRTCHFMMFIASIAPLLIGLGAGILVAIAAGFICWGSYRVNR